MGRVVKLKKFRMKVGQTFMLKITTSIQSISVHFNNMKNSFKIPFQLKCKSYQKVLFNSHKNGVFFHNQRRCFEWKVVYSVDQKLVEQITIFVLLKKDNHFMSPSLSIRKNSLGFRYKGSSFSCSPLASYQCYGYPIKNTRTNKNKRDF